MKPFHLEAPIRTYPGVSILLSLALITPNMQAASKPAAAPQKVVSENVVEAAQKEIERRQSMLTRAQADIKAGKAAQKVQDYDTALAAYRKAVEEVPESPNASAVATEAMDGFRDSSLELAKVRITEGRYGHAEQILNELLAKEPTCRAATRLKTQLGTPGYYNKTVTPLFRADIEQVKQWLLDGQGFYDTGRYDLALKRADQVLSKDPYNVAARKLQEISNQAISSYGGEAYNEARSRALAKVDKTWQSPVRRFGAASSATPVTTKIESSQVEKLRKKINDLVIPEFKCTDLPLTKVAEALTELSKDADKSTDATKGVVILVNIPGASSGPAPKAGAGTSVLDLAPPSGGGDAGGATVTIPLLPNFKLVDILQAVASQSGTKWTITESYVKFVPNNVDTEKVIPKSWPVSPWFFSSGPKVDAELSSGGLGGLMAGGKNGSTNTPMPKTGRSRIDAKEVLTSQGVKFDATGSTASYNPRAQTLTVLNTPDQLEVVDSLVRDADQLAPTQVEIQAKFVEFSQNNTKELSFDWMLGQSNLPGSSRIFSGGGTTGTGEAPVGSNFPFTIPNGFPNAGSPVGVNPLTAANRSGSMALSSNAVDALLSGVTGGSRVAPAALSLAGAFTDPQFQVVIRALNQSKGVDLLSSPSITARSGSEATIEIVREFIYPSDFSPPQVPQNVGGGNGGAAGGGGGGGGAAQSIPVTPTTPSAWTTRNTGVRLPVTPTIQGDNYTVDLDLQPEVTEFEGFINYGSPIQAVTTRTTLATAIGTAAATPTAVTLTPNVINQPIFSVRRIKTLVSILDGETIALGGLIREDVQKINDKVPLLGDMPLVGRLFRSNVDQHIKKNLTIFVTVRLIDAAGQPVNSKDAIEDAAPSAPVPSLTEASLPLIGR
ncbi:MAG: type II and III secretion system protein [Verrucomicrobiota bacterium]